MSAKDAVAETPTPGKITAIPAPPPNLRRKLVNVMAAVKYIQKTGRNKFHGYNYATEADVAEKVRAAFVEQGLIMVPRVGEIGMRGDGKSQITRVSMVFTILDADSEETLDIPMPGEGQDAQDKGVYKAITGAEKYALMKLFLIPTGDDPEKDDGHENGNGEAIAEPLLSSTQVKEIEAKLAAVGSEAARLLSWLQYAETLSEVYAKDYDRIIAALEKKGKKA